MTKKYFKLELLDSLEQFLTEIESLRCNDLDDLLSHACEGKEYLDEFFTNFIYQFCELELGIDPGQSNNRYLILLGKVTPSNEGEAEKDIKDIVKKIKIILQNRSDFLEQEYIEVPHEFEKFIRDVFPSFLMSVNHYVNKVGLENHDRKIAAIRKRWKKDFKI